jgi:magnesium transporter
MRRDNFCDAVIDTTRSRFSWLLINLMMAIIASIVSGFSTRLLRKSWRSRCSCGLLHPWVGMPVTVVVRALAVRELPVVNALRIIDKETFVGGIDGILFVIGVVDALWFGEQIIGIIISAAMVINLLLAGVAGTVIPLELDRLGC